MTADVTDSVTVVSDGAVREVSAVVTDAASAGTVVGAAAVITVSGESVSAVFAVSASGVTSVTSVYAVAPGVVITRSSFSCRFSCEAQAARVSADNMIPVMFFIFIA